MLQKPENSTTKIFARAAKAYGHKHLPLSVVDIMLASPDKKYTILSLKKALHKKHSYWYDHKTIESCINCINDMQHIILHQHRLTRGRNTRVKGFTISISHNINNTDNDKISD